MILQKLNVIFSMLTRIFALSVISLLFVFNVSAQTNVLGGDLSANISVLSDYRFRGVSRTDNDFAVQGNVDWYHASGLYSGVFASNIDDRNGADVETNFYAGYSTEHNGLTYDVGATVYYFPGGTNTDYIETYGSVGIDLGLLTSSVGVAYGFSSQNLGNQDNIYIYTDARGTIPDTPFSINARLGFEDGAFGSKKWDWKIGASVTYEQFEFGVSYIDTNKVGKRSDAGVIFSLGAYF